MPFHYDFRTIATRAALLDVLDISDQEFTNVSNFKPNASPLHLNTSDRLGQIVLPAFVAHRIPKKGKAPGVRLVWEPLSTKRSYKTLARRLESFFNLTLIDFPHDSVFGFRPGRNIRENATLHCGNKNLLNVDIHDFFPSISVGRVRDLFLKLDVNLLVSDLLARFLTVDGSLAPGLPTSPVISNAIALPMDIEYARMAKQMNTVYSRYADDLSFSGNDSLPSVESLRT